MNHLLRHPRGRAPARDRQGLHARSMRLPDPPAPCDFRASAPTPAAASRRSAERLRASAGRRPLSVWRPAFRRHISPAAPGQDGHAATEAKDRARRGPRQRAPRPGTRRCGTQSDAAGARARRRARSVGERCHAEERDARNRSRHGSTRRQTRRQPPPRTGPLREFESKMIRVQWPKSGADWITAGMSAFQLTRNLGHPARCGYGGRV
jgi:hypothetical protein